MFDYQGVLSDEIDMNSSLTFMDHETGIQPSPGNQCCYSMDRSAYSDYGSELSNTRNPMFENSSSSCVGPYAKDAHDSLSLLQCLEGMVVDTQAITASCAWAEPNSMASLLVDKSLNQEVARTTSLDASAIPIADSSSSNYSSAKIAMSCDLESLSDERLESCKNGFTLPSHVEHNGSESKTIIANYPCKSDFLPSMCQDVPLDTIVTNPPTTSMDHCTEIQPKQYYYSVDTPLDPDDGTGPPHSRYPEMFENISSSEMLPNAERSHDSPSSFSCLQSMEIDTQVIKVGPARSFHVEKSIITKSTPLDTLESRETVVSATSINSSDKIATSCNLSCDENEVLKNGDLHTDVRPKESGYKNTSTNATNHCENYVFESTFDYQQAFSDEIVLKSCLPSINHDEGIEPSQVEQCCYSMDRSADPGNGSELSNSLHQDRFENTGAPPDIGIIAEGTHDSSSSFHCLQSLDVDRRMITAGLERSKSRSMTSVCVDKSLNRGFARSTSLDALGIEKTVSSSSSSNNSSAKIAMACDSKSPSNKTHDILKNAYTFLSNVGHERFKSKTTNMVKSLNFEDGKKLIGVTRAKSEPRSMYVASTMDPDVEKSVSMGSLNNLRTEPISPMEIGSVCSIPAQICQSESTLIGSKIITCVSPSTGYKSKQSTGLIRAKSEPRSSKTSELRSTKTSGLNVDATVNKEIMRSISLDMLDSTSSGKSCLATACRSSAVHTQEEDSCTEDCRQTIHTLPVPDIDDISSQDSTQFVSSTGILNGDEIHGEEEDVKPVIKLEPIDDDYSWGLSIDVPCDELLGHVKQEPSEELRLKNCRVSLEKLPSHVIESCARVRLWKSKTAIKKRNVRTKLGKNVKPRCVISKKPPSRRVIENGLKLKECRVVLYKLATDPTCVKVGLKECRVVLEKLPYYKVLCLDFGIQESRVVLNRLPDYLISSSSSRMNDCRVVLERLPEHETKQFGYSSSARSKVELKKRKSKPTMFSSRRILTSRLGIRIV